MRFMREHSGTPICGHLNFLSDYKVFNRAYLADQSKTQTNSKLY